MGENVMSPLTPSSSLAADSGEIEEMIASICMVTSDLSRLIRGRRLRTMPMGKYSTLLIVEDVVAVVRDTGI